MDVVTATNVTNLGEAAVKMAAKAAAEKLRTTRPDLFDLVRDRDSNLVDFLLRDIREAVAADINEALDDAKEALEAMPGASLMAEATFMASMVLAGVKAAERFIADEDAAKAAGV